jgi:hypothetical protein
LPERLSGFIEVESDNLFLFVVELGSVAKDLTFFSISSSVEFTIVGFCSVWASSGDQPIHSFFIVRRFLFLSGASMVKYWICSQEVVEKKGIRVYSQAQLEVIP